MKYLAILKDSMREAIDTKVFYAMLAMSLVLIVLVGSIGFRPIEGAEALPAMLRTGQFTSVSPERGKSPSLFAKRRMLASVNISGIKQLTDASAPSARDYAFTLTIDEQMPFALDDVVDFWSKPTPADAHPGMEFQNRQNLKTKLVSNQLVEEFIKEQFATTADLTLDKVTMKVLQSPANEPGQGLTTLGKYSFDIQTKGRAGTKAWPSDISLFFGLVDPQAGFFRNTSGIWVFTVENTIVNSIGGWVALLVGVVITSFFIPNMLRKGTIDMLLAKPIHRPVLLIYKYIGGLTFMFLSSCVAIGGVWFVLGLRSGDWSPGFVLTIFTLTFFFAILYSVSALIGVLTRTPIVAILVTCIVWFGLWLVGQIYSALTMIRKEPALAEVKDGVPTWLFTTTDVLHFVLPRTSDLNVLNVHLVGSVLTDNERRLGGFLALPDVSWTESITVSLVFISVMLGLACWRFSRKDF
jgi:ABC-type transport system involved in multi-copper enzyme maturation permease subunit